MAKPIDCQDFFEKAMEHFLRAVLSESYADFERSFVEALKELPKALKNASDDTSTGDIRQVAYDLREVARFFLDLHRASKKHLEETRNERNVILQSSSTGLQDKKGRHDKLSNTPDLLSSQYLRQWFLENFANPFPKTAEKHYMAKAINIEIGKHESSGTLPSIPFTYDKVQLWLINARRRSQWTHFFRLYGGSDLDRMLELCSVLDRRRNESDDSIAVELEKNFSSTWTDRTGEGLQQHVRDCIELYARIVNWLEGKPKEEARSCVDDAIREGKAEYREAKAKSKEEKRRVQEVQAVKARKNVHSKRDTKGASERMRWIGEFRLQSATSGVNKGKKRMLEEDDDEDEANYKSSEEERDELSPSVSPTAFRMARKRLAMEQAASPRRPSTTATKTPTSRTASGSSSTSASSSMPSLIEAGESSYDSSNIDLSGCSSTVQDTSFYACVAPEALYSQSASSFTLNLPSRRSIGMASSFDYGNSSSSTTD